MVGNSDVTSVTFDLSCDNGFTLSGELNVVDDRDPPVFATIMAVPVGDCSITLTASDEQGATLCEGSKDFTVLANETVIVDVALICAGDGEELLGNAEINGTFVFVDGNACPRLHFFNAVPINVPAEGSAATVLVSDREGDPITTLMTATGGSFADPSAQSTTYTCDGAAGNQTLTVTVGNGEPACEQSKTFDVTCPGTNPCDGVICDDTGNECTAAECNPDTGQCEIVNLDGNQCTAGGGGGELAVNGGFETGNLDGWTRFCGGPNNGSCEATMAEARTGLWSGRVVTAGAPANPTIKQANLAIGVVQPNSEITIRFSMKGSTGPGGIVFAGLLSEFLPEGATREDLGGGPLFPTDQWVDYEFTTNTGPDVANGVSLELNAICGAVEGCFVDVFFDDVSIVIPGGGSEPGICDAGICVPNVVDLCEGNTCDNDDTECSDSSCDPGTGQCVATPINEGGACEGGAGTCNAGVCEPNAQVVYEQNFNLLPIDGAVIGDGWLYFINVAAPVPYGYGGPAPNGPQICALVDDQGGPEQEPQQLSVYSDYNNLDHGNGYLIETNVFQEPFGFNNRIPASEVGKTYTFLFQAKAGNIGASTTANAFIKVLNPDAGFAETAADRQDTTSLPADWGGYSVSLTIDASWVGQILQYGFTTNATNFEPSGNFYDNVVLTTE
ncbi:MAG: hypothetical protein WBN38_14465 [Polyangiales bacterium]